MKEDYIVVKKWVKPYYRLSHCKKLYVRGHYRIIRIKNKKEC